MQNKAIIHLFSIILILVVQISSIANPEDNSEDTTVPLDSTHVEYKLQFDEIPAKLGYPFHNEIDSNSLYIGHVKRHTPSERNRTNLEHSGDLLDSDIRFYHPDIPIDGRDYVLRTVGAKPENLRLIWRDRPLRNIRNMRPDFNSIPHHFIGSIHSAGIGSIDGVISSTGIVEFQPVEMKFEESVTSLHHRDGYYGFEPVEALYSRRINKTDLLQLGMQFPTSAGTRYLNSAHDGHTLFVEYDSYFNESSTFSVCTMTRKDKTGMISEDISRKYNDNNWDVEFKKRINSRTVLQLNGVQNWRVESESKFHSYSRETGLGMRLYYQFKNENDIVDSLELRSDQGFPNLQFTFRGNKIDIDTRDSESVRLTELETSVIMKAKVGIVSGSVGLGAYGWYPDRVGSTAILSLETNETTLGTFHMEIAKSVDPHSPETMFAQHKADQRPTDHLVTLMRVRDSIAVHGKILRVSSAIGYELGWKRNFQFSKFLKGRNSDLDTLNFRKLLLEKLWKSKFEFGLTTFYRSDINPHFWTVNGDTALIPETGSNQSTSGWSLELRWILDRLYGGISIIKLFNEEIIEYGVPFFNPEPSLRLRWNCGWHRVFREGRFEADISLSGKYFNSFFDLNKDGWQRVGGAYPLDFRASARISKFTLTWGLHNWNNYSYRLIPEYKMMHKEEYFEINWILID